MSVFIVSPRRSAILSCSLLVALCAAAGAAAAQDHWTAELYAGDAYNFRTKLGITQQGGYSQSVNADYETRGLSTPVYYVVRGARWSGDAGWELALIHDKLYLNNPPSGTSSLQISHGFNIVPLTRAYRAGDWAWRLGAGPVLTHAEAVINGASYDGPTKLSGVAALAGGGWRFRLAERAFVSIEAMLSAAYARPTLPGSPSGELEVRNVAVHGLFGFGYDF